MRCQASFESLVASPSSPVRQRDVHVQRHPLVLGFRDTQRPSSDSNRRRVRLAAQAVAHRHRFGQVMHPMEAGVIPPRCPPRCLLPCPPVTACSQRFWISRHPVSSWSNPGSHLTTRLSLPIRPTCPLTRWPNKRCAWWKMLGARLPYTANLGWAIRSIGCCRRS